ncbi:MarR-family transcriptional regulator [Streptomyces sviceus ATCC 29083]|uniref:MarR-family transcriptional regulator n=2 Tax=Streptomyces TaxID=1883 RepID=B5HRG4_STRX2|nr:MarR-family transcriptional regulator [Streptomyces sviceus ATCC 29083]
MMSDTPWLSEEEMRAWLAYIDLSTLLGDYLERQLQRAAGLSHATYNLLSRLSVAPDRSLRMSDLAEHLKVTRSRLSHALSALEKRGWARRTDDPTDQRGQLAVLTDEGFAVLAAAAPSHVAAARRAMFDHLTPDQARQFAEIGEAIIKGLTHEDDYQAELPWRRR